LPSEQRVGLIGHPVGHSVSPQFQQAAFDYCRIPARYELWDTEKPQLPARVQALRESGFLGGNVTIPHKQAVLHLVDDCAKDVELTGAANTLVNEHGRLVAHNTDVGGFVRALRSELGYEARGKRVGLLGAGGAARGVIAGLAADRADAIVILNRSADRAHALVRELGPRLGLPLQAGPLDASAGARLAGCDLIVNCTSIGMAGSEAATQMPLLPSDLPEGATVVDIVANPLVTPLLAAASERGYPALGGLAMLVHQGALAFELWTGVEAPVDVMLAAARAAMAARTERP
jgi:shikimate dehydrogenase